MSQEFALDVDENEMFTDLPVRSVGQIVGGPLLTCPPEMSVAEAARRMEQKHCSSIVVVEDGFPVGIWTERDALNLDFSAASFDQPIRRVMSRALLTIPRSASISEAGVRFKNERVRHLLVIDEGGRPVGMLSQTDVVMNHGVEHYLTFRDVRSVISKRLAVIDADLGLAEAARLITESNGEAAIVHSSDWSEDGIVTERDIVRLVAHRSSGPVGQAASRPVVAVHPNSTLLSARNLFHQHGFRHLAVRESDGAYAGLLSFSDILSVLQYEYVAQLNSALRERDEALLSSRKDLHLARQVIEASLDGVMIVNAEGKIEYVNPSFTQLTGYGAEEVIGRNPNMLKSGRHDAAFYKSMWTELRAEGHWRGEIWNRRKNGELFAEWLTINSIRDERGNAIRYAAIFSDITERKRDEERIRNLAYYDALTTLPNRRLLMDRLHLALANAHRHGALLAVMFLDVDFFKRINDTLGHDIGDAVLVEVAKRLQASLRDSDTVARLGGDEFVILLPELDDISDAARLAERLTHSLREPMNLLGGRTLTITTSIGIALHPEDGDTPDTLLKAADLALYQTKERGRNGYSLRGAASNARSAAKLSAESELRQAIRQDRLHLAYQVKVDITTRGICGVEALLRWNHPDRGVVPPSEFIPMAERLGLMSELGEWTLRTACRQNQAWVAAGLPPIPMAVNLSARQFLHSGLPERVTSILQETGMPANLLELELTESTILAHPTEVACALNGLHEAGVSIAIDDFGIRQSSLMALRYLPIDALKIDRSFIEGLGQAFEEKNIVAAIVRLAHALGMKAVAEGVESVHQVDVLRRAGCDEIQGWLIGRAVLAEQLPDLFDRPLLPI